jgi:hypothetical protein
VSDWVRGLETPPSKLRRLVSLAADAVAPCRGGEEQAPAFADSADAAAPAAAERKGKIRG